MLINGRPAGYRNEHTGTANSKWNARAGKDAGSPTGANSRIVRANPNDPRLKAENRARDPHLGLRFWIQLGQIEIAGFRECSGLSIETETFEYAEGGLNTYTHQLPVRVKYQNITLKRGLDRGRDLFDWYWRAAQGQIARQPISIIVYDSLGEIVQKWDLQNAFPCKWNGPGLDAREGEIAVESVEIAHEGLLPSTGVSDKQRIVTPRAGVLGSKEKSAQTKKRSLY